MRTLALCRGEFVGERATILDALLPKAELN